MNSSDSERRSPPRSPDQGGAPPWAHGLVRVLDNALRVPGTNFRIGLDGLLGLFFPGLGDTVGAAASVSLLWLAFQMRVPKVVLGRMVVNVAVDALVGAVPLLGDLFDFAWRANAKNLALIQRHRGEPGSKPQASDYLVVGLAVAAALFTVALPIVLGYFLLSGLSRIF